MAHTGFRSPQKIAPRKGNAANAPLVRQQQAAAANQKPANPTPAKNPNSPTLFKALRGLFAAAAAVTAGVLYMGHVGHEYDAQQGPQNDPVSFVPYTVFHVFHDAGQVIKFSVNLSQKGYEKATNNGIYEKVTGRREQPTEIVRNSIVVGIPKSLIDAGWLTAEPGSKLAQAKDAVMAQVRNIAIARSIPGNYYRDGEAFAGHNLCLHVRDDILALYNPAKGANQTELFTILPNAPGTPQVLNTDTPLRITVGNNPQLVPY